MPTYVYRCRTCGVTFECQQKMMDAPLTDCPDCGGGVHRVIQPVPIFFKGPGFYVTDSKHAGSTTSVPDNGQEPQNRGSAEEGATKAEKVEKKEAAENSKTSTPD